MICLPCQREPDGRGQGSSAAPSCLQIPVSLGCTRPSELGGTRRCVLAVNRVTEPWGRGPHLPVSALGQCAWRWQGIHLLYLLPKMQTGNGVGGGGGTQVQVRAVYGLSLQLD